MKKLGCSFLVAAFFFLSATLLFAYDPVFDKITISDKFNSEGAAAADFNNDGQVDIVSGHFWYEGPEFKVRHQIFEGSDYSPESYSESFVNFTYDFNRDGWVDLLVCPHPGKDGFWYENPKGEDRFWTPHLATHELGGESQTWIDVDGDGEMEIVFNRIGKFGYCKPNPEKPYEPWDFIQVSPDDEQYIQYFEGCGAGDINGDGKVDLLEKQGWWEQPQTVTDTPWRFHPYPFTPRGANILVTDVDGDGLNDVITTLECHNYGLAWYKQIRKEDGAIDFIQNTLIPSDPADDFFPKVSQLHSMVLADMNGDGVDDFVTGKRYLAHGSHMDSNPLDPPMLLWYEVKRGENGAAPELIPHAIDNNSGVGTQVWAGDVNGDGRNDIVVGNKKGTFVFLSNPSKIADALMPHVTSRAFPGAVSVLYDPKQGMQFDCIGWSNIEKSEPMKRDSFFWIASQTKEIVCTGVLMLVDEGKVFLDDPVEKYLPEFAGLKIAQKNEDGTVTLRPIQHKPTIREAMSHTSGLPFITPTMARIGIDCLPMRVLLSTVADNPISSEPGTEFQYSNIGIDIGSGIIEVVTGQKFEDFLDERFFQPLGMKDTTFWPNEEQLSRLVQAYRIGGENLVPCPVPQLQYPLQDRTKRFAEAGGGLFSTPEDMIKYLAMLANKGVYNGKRFLSEESVEMLANKQTPDGVSTGYSFGFWTIPGGFWHGGALATYGEVNLVMGQARLWMVQLEGDCSAVRTVWKDVSQEELNK